MQHAAASAGLQSLTQEAALCSCCRALHVSTRLAHRIKCSGFLSKCTRLEELTANDEGTAPAPADKLKSHAGFDLLLPVCESVRRLTCQDFIPRALPPKLEALCIKTDQAGGSLPQLPAPTTPASDCCTLGLLVVSMQYLNHLKQAVLCLGSFPAMQLRTGSLHLPCLQRLYLKFQVCVGYLVASLSQLAQAG